MGMSGAKVWDAFQDGDIAGIRNYCETDVLNTWLVYLRFQLMRGHLDQSAYDAELELVRTQLRREAKPHFLEFLAAWEKNSPA
jgi:predicted PolB exonuclease-like 3'-5' exonuclease